MSCISGKDFAKTVFVANGRDTFTTKLTKSESVSCIHSVHQIRRGERDNLRIIFHTTPFKLML